MSKPRIRLILQSRLSSTRLPAKMLLPLGGLPLVALCAKRAMFEGVELIVATSEHSSDDLLAETLKHYKIHYMRGDLNNVLDRFIKASEDLDENDIVVRLTGDNPFIDGAFLQSLIQFHNENGKDYTRTSSPIDGFPYGLSAEVVRVGALRDITKSATSQAHKEHVTLALAEKENFALYINNNEDLSHLRITIDTFEDYVLASRVFKDIENPLTIPWQKLVEKLQSFDETPKFKISQKIKNNKPHSIMALGTAQLGLNYGISNNKGKPSDAEASAMINLALKHGVTLFDTASAYGDSEDVLGNLIPDILKSDLSITTKLAPLEDITSDMPDAEIQAHVENSVYKSLYKLGLKKLPVLMLHRWDHYNFKEGLIVKTLMSLKQKGVIEQLGCSIQTPDEGLLALKESELTFIQMPFNIIDDRWHKSGFIDTVQRHNDKHIQARSVILQGLLNMPAENWPVHKESAKDLLKWLHQTAKEYHRNSVLDLCYAYVNAQPWIDSVVVGTETKNQLFQNLELFNAPPLKYDEILQINSVRPSVSINLLNPATWKKI